MSQACTVCIHTQRQQIEEEILKGEPPLRVIAERSGLSKTAVWRHKQHLPLNAVSAAKAAKTAHSDALRVAVEALISDLRGVLRRAKRKRNDEQILRTVKEISRMLEFTGRLDGRLEEQAQRSEVHFHLPVERALLVAQTYIQRHGVTTLATTSEAKSTDEGRLSQ